MMQAFVDITEDNIVEKTVFLSAMEIIGVFVLETFASC